MEKRIKAEVLVVDDHALILEGVCKLIGKMSDVVVADAVTSGEKALVLIAKRDYDVYLLDMGLPDVSGFELIERIREMNDQARIVVNTMHEEVWMVNRLVQSGVNAIVLKSSATSELTAAIGSVLQGNFYTCPRFRSVSQKLKRTLGGLHSKDLPTKRELAVLQAIAQGMNTHEIAALLEISENTVETFRKRLMGKFAASNVVDLVIKAISQGWVIVK